MCDRGKETSTNGHGVEAGYYCNIDKKKNFKFTTDFIIL